MQPQIIVKPLRRKLDSVQCLRALAAFVVVLGHVSAAARLNPEIFGAVQRMRFPGGSGVDVFFLLSGFIMAFSSEHMFGSAAGSREFLLRRLVRIVPLYWSATTLALILAALGRRGLPGVPAIAASFAFVPYDTMGRADGFAFPILDLGWTLNYEMLFYLVFAAFLPLRRSWCLIGVAVVMVTLVGFGQAFAPTLLPLRFWSRPIILEFVAGMFVAWSYRAGWLAFQPMVRLLLVAVSFVMLVSDPFHLSTWSTTPNDFSRVGDWGGPSTLLLLAAVSGRTPLDSLPARLLVRLGDASYALYLLHPFVILVMLRVAATSFFPHRAPTLFVPLTLLIACATAILSHKWIERPVTVWLTRLLQRLGAPIHRVPLLRDAKLARRPLD